MHYGRWIASSRLSEGTHGRRRLTRTAICGGEMPQTASSAGPFADVMGHSSRSADLPRLGTGKSLAWIRFPEQREWHRIVPAQTSRGAGRTPLFATNLAAEL